MGEVEVKDIGIVGHGHWSRHKGVCKHVKWEEEAEGGH